MESIIKQSIKQAITLNEFTEAIKLILNSTFFLFKKRYYRQIFDTPMGSSLSPIIALVLQDLEQKVFEQLHYSINPLFQIYR